MKSFLKYIPFFCAFVFFKKTNAQIYPISTHFFENKTINHPSFYGDGKNINLLANYRYQWAALEGNPKTFNFVADAYLSKIKGGIGIHLQNDMIGAFNINTIKLGYNYRLQLKKVQLSAGANVGVILTKLNGSKLITPDGNYVNTINHLDDYLATVTTNSIKPNITASLSVQHKFLNFSISYWNIINNKDKFKNSTQNLQVKYNGVLNTLISSDIQLGNKISLQPTVNIITDFKNVQTDLSIIAGYNNFIYAGLSTRGYNKKSFEALSPIIMIKPIKNMTVVYSYDINMNTLSNVSNGSHEITLKYKILNNKFDNKIKTIYNPRF